MEELKKEAIKGIINGQYVFVEGERELETLYERGFGVKEDGRLRLSLVAATILAEEGKLIVEEDGRRLDIKEILSKAIINNPKNILKYFTFKDLKSKGRILKVEPSTPFMRLYPRGGLVGSEVSKILVYSLSEDEPIKQADLMETIRYSSRIRKTLLLAVIDDETNISYYTAQQFEPDKIREPVLPKGSYTAHIIHDRIIVWDKKASGEIYSSGYWGHPVGIRKPSVEDASKSYLQLSMLEGIYLAKKEVLRIIDPRSGENISPDKLIERLSQLRRNYKSKLQVFSFWRDKGYIVKPASKYGTDFMFYKYGPGIDHAPYICIASHPEEHIIPVDLIRAGRIATTVRKTLIVSVAHDGKIFNYRVKWYKP